MATYVAWRCLLEGLGRWAVEPGRERITVNRIFPGPIHAPMNDAVPEEHKTPFARRRTALARCGGPEEVAQVTASLCPPAAPYFTDAVIPVGGGLMARNA
jgi:3-oxoacyl-[acyl-carrier protein] reductase